MEHLRVVSSRPAFFRGVFSEKKELLPVAAILVAVFFWGASFAGMRVALTVLNPWAVMWCRMMVAFVLILPFAGKVVPKDYRKGDWKLLVPMVFFQPCLYFLLESYALKFTTSSQAGVIAASVPVMVSFGAFVFLSEAMTKRSAWGLFLSVAGVACLTMLEGAGGVAENALLGNSLELVAMASAAANMLIVKRLSQRYNPWTLTAMQVLAGALFFLPGLKFLMLADPAIFGPRLIFSLSFLGAFVTLGAFGLYNWGISRIPASRASVFINLVPVIAVAIGWGLLGEALTLFQTVAAAGIVAGVWLSQVSNRQ